MADVSVIIPCYNRRAFLGAALESVLQQTEPVGEVLVVDDGSSDGSAELADEFSRRTGGQVRVIRQANGGVSKARNRGLDEARGQYLAFLDADDLWHPDKTRQQLALLEEKPGTVGVYCPVQNFRSTPGDLAEQRSAYMVDDPFPNHILLTMCIQASTAILKREMVKDLRFDESTGHAEDTMYFADCRLRGRWRATGEALVAYRVHASQATAHPMHILENTLSRVRWCESRWDAMGPAVAAETRDRLWANLIWALEHRYWRRELTGLAVMRERILAGWPTVLDSSFLKDKTLYPRWVYRLTDPVLGVLKRRPSPPPSVGP